VRKLSQSDSIICLACNEYFAYGLVPVWSRMWFILCLTFGDRAFAVAGPRAWNSSSVQYPAMGVALYRWGVMAQSNSSSDSDLKLSGCKKFVNISCFVMLAANSGMSGG